MITVLGMCRRGEVSDTITILSPSPYRQIVLVALHFIRCKHYIALFERICENRSLSDFSQREANVGEFSEQNPDRMLLLRTPSSRSRSEAFVKPHHAGDAYNSRERIIDLNTWSRPASFNPCARRVLRANNAREQVDTVSSICWDTENVFDMVTPNIFIDSERAIPGIRAGGVIARLLLGLEKIISTVLELFRVRLFRVAHSLMLEISSILVPSMDDGTMRYVSSANFTSLFCACLVFKSPALTT